MLGPGPPEANFLSKQMEKLRLMMAQSELVKDPKVGPLLPVWTPDVGLLLCPWLLGPNILGYHLQLSDLLVPAGCMAPAWSLPCSSQAAQAGCVSGGL